MSAPIRTLVDLLLDRVEQSPDRLALRFQDQDEIRALTWQEIAADVERVVAGMVDLGVRPGDRVAQLSENRYEWILADLAILLTSAIHVPIHAPLAADQVAYQVRHSGAKLLYVSGATQQDKLDAVAGQLPDDLPIVSYQSSGATPAGRPLTDFHTWLEAEPESATTAAIRSVREQTAADSLATILYTSGTTGQPKGVMLSHENLVTNAIGCAQSFDMVDLDVRLCFLPLSHIFARTADLYTWIASGGQLCLATSRDTVLADCQWAQPTALNGVPYFYDRIYRFFQDQGRLAETGALQQLLGGKIRICGTGGAALPIHLFDWFEKQDVTILQGYGLTESSPVITISTPTVHRKGSSGKPLPGVEIRIAEDGEILSRGPHIMQGYWQDEAATAEVLQNGWLKTGDLGRIDDDGFLYITGRKKELIVTAAGKNIGPVLIESLLTEDPLIDQALVVGDGRNYLTALIVPNWDAIGQELKDLDTSKSIDQLCDHIEVRELVARQIESRLTCVSYHEQVRKFTLLTRPFSIERHEMTPKMSLRRPIIHQHFAAEIDAMYRR